MPRAGFARRRTHRLRMTRRAANDLSASVEPDVAVGEPLGAVAGVVGTVVVMAAEQLALVEVGAAALGPGIAAVVRFAPGPGDVAAWNPSIAGPGDIRKRARVLGNGRRPFQRR